MRSNLQDKIGTGKSAIKMPHTMNKDPNVLPIADSGMRSPRKNSSLYIYLFPFFIENLPYPIVVKEITAHQNECGIP
jgi:hypothetical protein